MSANDRYELRFGGLAVRFGGDWRVTAAIPHDTVFEHRGVGLSLQLRGWPQGGDLAALRAHLLAQAWPGPPLDLSARTVQGLAIVGATFREGMPGHFVREWFLSDGSHGANAALLFPYDTPRTSLEPFEQLLDSVTFLGS